MPQVQLARKPQTDYELWLTIRLLWGITIPRVKVCDDHVAPFTAVADAYFGRVPGYAVWYASRGSGKSEALAVLGLTKAFIRDIDVTILGGSMTQSKNVAEHMTKLLAYKNAPVYAIEKHIQSEIRLRTQKTIRPLPASQTTVRGPHPPLQLLDEVDEMDLEIYDASMGQAMEQTNSHGELVEEYIVASSTWQNPEGTFTEVIERARKNGLPIYTWCWRELIKTPTNPSGWMSQRFIDQKRNTVSAQMWHTEYELNEPSGASRAFDLDRVETYFVPYPEPIAKVDKGDEERHWVWETWQPSGLYAVGADWAKEKDFTVISVIRYDTKPYRLVKRIKINKRPYPVMIGMFNREITAYHAVGTHDKTGLGNVVHDFIDFGDTVEGFVMVGRPRTQMLLDYIAAFEHGDYALPKGDEKQEGLDQLKRAHRATTVADVYAPGKWDSHLPDDVSSMALAHRAIAKRAVPTTESSEVPKSQQQRKVDALFAPPSEQMTRTEGGIYVVEERYDGPASTELWTPRDHDAALDLLV